MVTEPKDQSLVTERIRLVKERFAAFDTWELRYRHLIELGQGLQDWPESERRPELKVKGCQSQVWLKAHLTADGLIVYAVDSDALIVKGLAALLVSVLSHVPPQQVLVTSAEFLTDLGLRDHLSPSRANGLLAMFKQFKIYAMAFETIRVNKIGH